ncbi:MAG: guanylate kinase [Oscillospiraceae bacterium]|nr:guanylate kinase [Oscillospiraceae bacterium]
MTDNSKGLLVILSGPSGSGKDTVITHALEEMNGVKLSVSLTTRPPRPWEKEGEDYYFCTREQFQDKIAAGDVLEYAEYNGNFYGTPREPVEEWVKAGNTMILNIEVIGAEKVRARCPEAVSVFLVPPSMKVLEERLRARDTGENPEVIAGRLKIAERELGCAGQYDYIICNDDLKEAVKNLKAIIHAEHRRTKRQIGFVREVLKKC